MTCFKARDRAPVSGDPPHPSVDVLKDTYIDVSVKRNSTARCRADATTRLFHGVSERCCDIIPSVYTASTRPRVATHARTRAHGMAVRATPVQPESKYRRSRRAAWNGTASRSICAGSLTSTYTHPREHARKVRTKTQQSVDALMWPPLLSSPP